MKRMIVKLFFLVIILLSLVGLQAQSFDFSVKSGTVAQGADFGYNLKPNICLYGGFDIIGMSVSVSGDDSYYEEYDGNTYTDVDKWDYSGSALLFIPRIGCKYKIAHKVLIPYVYTDLFKSFASVDVSGTDESYSYYNGELDYYDTDTIDGGKEADLIADFLGFWGMNIGFGVEYPISDQFGVSGEFGLKMIFASAEYNDSDYDYESYSSWEEEWSSQVATTFKITTTSIALNYHF